MSVTNEELSVSSGGGGGGTPTPAANTNNVTTGNNYGNTVGNGGSSSSSATNTPTSSSIMSTSFVNPSALNTSTNPTGNGVIPQSNDDIVKSGYLRKFKGSKKYFVLRKETERGPARLEYYANDKKFASGQRPRKSIHLRACFNINRTEVSKDKFTIALHTHNDCVRIIMNNEAEAKEWLRLMDAMLEDDEESENTITPIVNPNKPYFEHVWMVQALNKGLGSGQGILGQYRLCLTSRELQLLKVKGEHGGRNGELTFPLTVIRNVSHVECFFHIEFGRSACTGAGKLSLKTDDNNIAQNMHLLILNAMQNLPKEDEIRRDGWNGWNDQLTFPQEQQTRSKSFIGTPPRPVRPSPNDGTGSIRHRPGSISGGSTRGSYSRSHVTPMDDIGSGSYYGNSMMPVGSAESTSSSSFSMDYENNNNNNSFTNGSSHPASHSLEQESDYVDTSIGVTDPASEYVDPSLQSPVSPYENYILMSPAGTVGSGSKSLGGGKVSVSHSRNSSLIEDQNGYVPMVPGAGNHSHSRSESGAASTAGSTTGLDDAYFDMEFNRKLDLSSDDVRRMSPSSESIQSGTPSSDCQLEKVSSYLQSDEFDDTIALRPVRAFSVGSRSDTSATGKSNRFKKNGYGLQSVQESFRSRGILGSDAAQEAFRTRAMSVGSKQPTRKVVNPSATSSGLSSLAAGHNSALFGSTRSALAAPLSSSWSGSTGRWLPPKIHGMLPPPVPNSSGHSPNFPQISHGAQDSADSDLMELDFSHNKHSSRKRSLPGPGGNLSSSSSGSGAPSSKISPCARAMLGAETPPIVETPDTPKSFSAGLTGNGVNNGSLPRSSYATSAPISIQKANKSVDCGGYVDSGNSILSRITGMDLNKLKELDDDGAYLEMDFNRSNTANATATIITSPPAVPKIGANQSLRIASVVPTVEAIGSNVENTIVPTAPVTEPNPYVSYNGHVSSGTSKPVVVIKANENVIATKFNCSTNSVSHNICNEQPSLSRSLSSSSNISTISNNSTSSSTSCVSVKIQPKAPSVSPERSVPSTLPLQNCLNTNNANVSGNPTIVTSAPTSTVPAQVSTLLTRIEESPEKHQNQRGKSSSKHPHLNLRKLSPSAHGGFFSSRKKSPSKEEKDATVTYASIQHSLAPMLRRNNSFPSEITGAKKQLPISATSGSIATTCGKQSQTNGLGPNTTNFTQLASTGPSHVIADGVTYTQVEFGSGASDLCGKRK